MYRETKARSFAKAISNRLINSFATFLLVWVGSGDISVAWKVATADVVVKFVLFYLNERIWDKLRFGKREIKPIVIWFSGLPFSGKSLLASDLVDYYKKRGLTVQRLDGDDVRTLFPLGGFTREERDAYLMRMGYFAKLLVSNGVMVFATFISPYEKSREYNRDLIGDYFEVFVSTPQEVCEQWDEWGSYEKARNGEIDHFVGVQEPFEPPQNPEVTVDLSVENRTDAVMKIQKAINRRIGNVTESS